MRDVSQLYVFSIICDVIFAGFVSGNSFDVIKRVDEVVNITISDHLREVLLWTVIYPSVIQSTFTSFRQMKLNFAQWNFFTVMISIQNLFAIHLIGGQMKNAIGEIVVGSTHRSTNSVLMISSWSMLRNNWRDVFVSEVLLVGFSFWLQWCWWLNDGDQF